MAGGIRLKTAGSYVKVMTGYTGGSPLLDITGITSANPPVVTVTGHGLSDGDVVKITEVVGMTEVNSGVYIVDVVNSSTFSLRDTDASGYGTYSSGGKINPGTFSNLCELTAYARNGGTSPEIPATSWCSTAQEFEIGLPDFGTTQLSFNFAPATTVQAALHTFYLSGDTLGIKVVLPGTAGSFTQLGHVQQESESGSVNGIWTASATIRNTGQTFRY